MTDRGLYLGSRSEVGDRTYRVTFFDFASQTATELFTTSGRLGFEIDVDPLDNRILVYDRTESVDSDIHAIENF